jgi:uncharacterized protein
MEIRGEPGAKAGEPSIASASRGGPLDLLILQASPFCNIDCAYCYLPDRASIQRMSRDTLEVTLRRVFSSRYCSSRFTVVWHAGEPLAVPLSFYIDAVGIIDRLKPSDVAVDHSILTNGTLVDEAWCDFIRKHQIHVGVSVDGPAALHDRKRRKRSGAGTYKEAMRGVRLLQEYGIDFYVLTVLTYDTLEYPDEMFDFYVSSGIRQVGFNIEEVENLNRASSLGREDTEALFRRFISRFHGLMTRNPESRLSVREFTGAEQILTSNDLARDPHSNLLTPFGIITVDWRGNFTTFSPEVLGAKSERYGDFLIGNVHRGPLEEAEESETFRRMKEDIEGGIELCRQSCEYFPMCGGGAPSNKFFENGTFRSTETTYCRLHRKVIIDVAVEEAELRLGHASKKRSIPVRAMPPERTLSEVPPSEKFDGLLLASGGRISRHRHFLGTWVLEQRLELSAGAWREGERWFPAGPWRPATAPELQSLAGEPEDPEPLSQVFTLPDRLRRSLLEAGLRTLEDPSAPMPPDFFRDFIDFYAFLSGDENPILALRFLIAQPNQRALSLNGQTGEMLGLGIPSGSKMGPRPGLLVNLSNERCFVTGGNLRLGEMQAVLKNALPEAPARVGGRFLEDFPQYPLAKWALEPTEGCFLAVDEYITALCTTGMREPGLYLVAGAPEVVNAVAF